MSKTQFIKKIFSPAKLFTWAEKQKPTLVKTPELITKVSVGPEHTIALGQSGNVYSFGEGQDGKLGHGDVKAQKQPKLIQYFQKHQIKITDVVAGQRHSIALSQKGEVYTWGFGKKQTNLLMKLFVNTVGPTGHGVDIPSRITKPLKVKALQGQNIKRISAGRNFCMCFNDKNEVYNWGNGEYAAFGDGENKNYDLPTKNNHFQYLRNDEKLIIKKIKSCQSFSVALMQNGKLYGWGSNQHGQMGIKSQIGMEMYETVNFVTEVIREGYDDKKVANFDISDTALFFQLQNEELWWAGMKIAYKPQKIKLDIKPKLFAAGQRSLAIVDIENNLYSKNGFVEYNTKEDASSIQTGFVKISGNAYFEGQIVGIGGQYGRRYALII